MLKKWLREYIQINKREILVIISFLLLGVIIGIVTYIFSSTEVKELAIASVREVFEISKAETYVKTNIILNGVKADIILIAVLAMMSVTLFGKWIIYMITILKGIALSIYTIILFNIFGPFLGMITFLLLVILINIIYIPAFIYIVVCFLDINFSVFKAKTSTTSLYKVIFTIIIGFILMFSSIVLEQLASTVVLDMYTKM